MSTKEFDDQTISDMLSITRVLYRGFKFTDDKRWDERGRSFADELTIDFGGVKPSQKTTPVELVAWARVAYALVKTQHMVFNLDVDVDGDRATSTCYGHARHERTDTGDFWHIYARYEHEYMRTPNGWKVSRIKMTPTFVEGNPKLLEESYADAKRE